jgi:Zn-dependent protease with chaperone function
MRLLLSAPLLGLAWFAASNAIASAGAWGAARFAIRRRGTLDDQGAALFLRLFPAAFAAVFVLGIFLPAHLRLEPADSDESFGPLLVGLAAIAVVLLARSLWRGAAIAAIAARTARLLRAAERTGDIYNVPDHHGISLAGVFRTRILVGAHARRILTPAELALAIAHERAHRRAYDNLKRCAIACAPDFFGGTRTARALEQQWHAQAECAADARAAAGNATRARRLASALVKVARSRVRQASAVHSPVWSTFHDAPLLEARVRRLVSGGSHMAVRQPRKPVRAVSLAATALAGLWYAGVPVYVHRITEAVVSALP